jgi:hypothetical protein
MAEQQKEMVTRSIYIDRTLYDSSTKAAGGLSVSQIISLLLEKWLNGKIQVEIKPVGYNERS